MEKVLEDFRKKHLHPNAPLTKRFQIGRGNGTGLGKTSGKGAKGHRARAGYSLLKKFEGGQMPLLMRLPKYGFSNAMHKKNVQAVTFREINGKFKDGDVLDLNLLKEMSIVPNFVEAVKFICKGELSQKLVFSSKFFFSEGAKSFIKKSGGSIQ